MSCSRVLGVALGCAAILTLSGCANPFDGLLFPGLNASSSPTSSSSSSASVADPGVAVTPVVTPAPASPDLETISAPRDGLENSVIQVGSEQLLSVGVPEGTEAEWSADFDVPGAVYYRGGVDATGATFSPRIQFPVPGTVHVTLSSDLTGQILGFTVEVS